MWSTATPYQQQVPRLGDLMLQKHQLNNRQLALAVMVQRREPHRALGEILIQLGFVSARQLHRNLRWQRYLRCASVALAFTLAPFQMATASDRESLNEKMTQFFESGQVIQSSASGINLLSYSGNKLTTFWSAQPEAEKHQVSFDEEGLKYTADLNFEGITLGVSFSF